MRHGTNGGYNYHGCRCESCRAARRAYMKSRRSKRPCSIDDCERPHWARGYCKPHYSSWTLYGDPLRARRNRRGQGDPPVVLADGRKICSFPGCTEPHHALGQCKRHYLIGYRMLKDEALSDTGRARLELAPFMPLLERLVTIHGNVRVAEKEFGLSHGQLRKYLNGKRQFIPVDVADRLCIEFGIPFQLMESAA